MAGGGGGVAGGSVSTWACRRTCPSRPRTCTWERHRASPAAHRRAWKRRRPAASNRDHSAVARAASRHARTSHGGLRACPARRAGNSKAPMHVAWSGKPSHNAARSRCAGTHCRHPQCCPPPTAWCSACPWGRTYLSAPAGTGRRGACSMRTPPVCCARKSAERRGPLLRPCASGAVSPTLGRRCARVLAASSSIALRRPLADPTCPGSGSRPRRCPLPSRPCGTCGRTPRQTVRPTHGRARDARQGPKAACYARTVQHLPERPMARGTCAAATSRSAACPRSAASNPAGPRSADSRALPRKQHSP